MKNTNVKKYVLISILASSVLLTGCGGIALKSFDTYRPNPNYSVAYNKFKEVTEESNAKYSEIFTSPKIQIKDISKSRYNKILKELVEIDLPHMLIKNQQAKEYFRKYGESPASFIASGAWGLSTGGVTGAMMMTTDVWKETGEKLGLREKRVSPYVFNTADVVMEFDKGERYANSERITWFDKYKIIKAIANPSLPESKQTFKDPIPSYTLSTWDTAKTPIMFNFKGLSGLLMDGEYYPAIKNN